MALINFCPQRDNSNPIREMETPYIRTVIHAKDRSWKHESLFKDWKRDVACKQFKDTYNWIGLWKNTGSTVHFTKSINLPSDGLYLIEIRTHRGPQQKGSITLKVDDVQIGDVQKPELKYSLPHIARYPVTYFDAGKHAFKLTLTKTTRVSGIKIYKIREFIGGTNTEGIASNRRLDLLTGEFTQNDTTDINTATLTLPHKTDFFDSNNTNSGHVFDLGDSVTIFLGDSPLNTAPAFGGYITGLHIGSEEPPVLTIDCEDRLMDLQREPLYNSFAMAVAAQQSSSESDSSATGSETSSDTVKTIMEAGAQYSYSHGCSSASCLISGGSGDCFAMSEFLFNKFKAAGIKCKIVQYATSEASNHRSVRIDVGNGWEDAPYRQYFNKTNLFNNTSSSKTSTNIIDSYAGSSSSTSTQTSTKTTTASGVGYVHHYGCYMGVGGTPCDDKYWENTCYSTTCKGTTHQLQWSPKNSTYHEWTCPVCDTDYDCITGKSKTVPAGADGSLRPWTGDKTGTSTVQSGSTSTVTKYQFSSVYETARFIALANEYDIQTDAVPHDHGFMQTFSSLEEYEEVSNNTVGYRTEWDTKHGSPAPSLKITPGKRSGNASCVLYEDLDGYDAATYKILYISYYGGGSSNKFQLKGNFKIDMYKENQTIDDAITYNIHFNGSLGQPHTLGGIKPKFNGVWQHEAIKLDELFDKKASSKEYHITRIAFEGTISTTDLKNRGKTAIWFDSVTAPKSEQVSQQNTSLDIKSNFENLQELMDNTDYVAYVKYGVERKDDILVVQPRGNTIVSEPVAVGYNMREIGTWDYTPKTDGLVNKTQKSYNVSSSDGTSDTSQTSTYNDPDSVFWYGPWQTYEDVDVTTKTECDAKAMKDVKEGSSKAPSFQLTLKGCLLFEPGQYAAVVENSRNINGVHIPKDISHTFDMAAQSYTTTISFNKPSKLFRNAILEFKKDIANQGVKTNGAAYTGVVLNIKGSSGTGSFTS